MLHVLHRRHDVRRPSVVLKPPQKFLPHVVEVHPVPARLALGVAPFHGNHGAVGVQVAQALPHRPSRRCGIAAGTRLHKLLGPLLPQADVVGPDVVHEFLGEARVLAHGDLLHLLDEVHQAAAGLCEEREHAVHHFVHHVVVRRKVGVRRVGDLQVRLLLRGAVRVGLHVTLHDAVRVCACGKAGQSPHLERVAPVRVDVVVRGHLLQHLLVVEPVHHHKQIEVHAIADLVEGTHQRSTTSSRRRSTMRRTTASESVCLCKV
mmetsp:Transcript_2776/g.6678  ORF Transcript_2776/g.6678 Transcript_2776/m.6678 type:complete len:262 (-) Transcript_2776:347-1132(-)